MAVCKECGGSFFEWLFSDKNIHFYQCKGCKRVVRYTSWSLSPSLPCDETKI